ncbi:MAG: SoxR reducing system RseC family protein [Ndongobacter sp.]|nr:SoxR reducing system RseC family protein [Ndongobacter sp.]
MLNKGIVIQRAGSRCEVLVYRTEACGSCSSCGACDAKPTQYWIDNPLDAQPGDEVTLEMENKRFFASIFLLYGLPLILFFVGMLFTYFVLLGGATDREPLALVGGLAGLALYYLAARVLDRRHETRDLVQMIAKRTSEEIEADLKKEACK